MKPQRKKSGENTERWKMETVLKERRGKGWDSQEVPFKRKKGLSPHLLT